MYWKGSIVTAIVLLVIDFLRSLYDERADRLKNTDSNGDRQKLKTKFLNFLLRHICIKRICDIVFEAGVVLLGALLAVGLTSDYDESVEQQYLLSTMSVVEQDMYMQAYMLEQHVMSYETGNIDVDSLKLNASIDIALLNEVLYDEYGMRTLKAGVYSILLDICREIERINALFDENREMSEDYIIVLCSQLIDDSRFAAETLKWTLDYNYGNINEQEYQVWYDGFMLRLNEVGIIYRMPIAE